jgi:catechol 2,3-dioxygenase-like lactoylglutathione lyase family enzyme
LIQIRVKERNMRALSILHPCITIPDMEEALAFFRDLLGFEVADQGAHDPKQLGPLLALDDPDVPVAIVTCPDGTEIELLEFRRPRGELSQESRPQDVGVRVVTIIVDEVDAMTARLAQAGYPPLGEIVPFAGPDRDLRAVHVPGPGGIPLTLGQWVEHPGTGE